MAGTNSTNKNGNDHTVATKILRHLRCSPSALPLEVVQPNFALLLIRIASLAVAVAVATGFPMRLGRAKWPTRDGNLWTD